MKLIKRRSRFREIPAASLPDIAFLLIIFFMVTSVLLLKQGLITVLPKASSQPLVLERKDILRIELFSDTRVLIDDAEYTLPELAHITKQILNQRAKTIMLLIDPHCKHKYVVGAIGQIQSLGISRLSIKQRKAADEDH